MIRAARLDDLPALAELTSELGYPVSADALARRFEPLLASVDHAVWVCEGADSRVVGWIHVVRAICLESDPRAEIYGLVVASEHRGMGRGGELVRRAIAWAEEQGLGKVRVRSNVVREEAHRFYRRLGFQVTKTQVVLDR